jgi:hypothetical protein
MGIVQRDFTGIVGALGCGREVGVRVLRGGLWTILSLRSYRSRQFWGPDRIGDQEGRQPKAPGPTRKDREVVVCNNTHEAEQ